MTYRIRKYESKCFRVMIFKFTDLYHDGGFPFEDANRARRLMTINDTSNLEPLAKHVLPSLPSNSDEPD